jgi:hypothetical protein
MIASVFEGRNQMKSKQKLGSCMTLDEVLHVGEVGRPKESSTRLRKDMEGEGTREGEEGITGHLIACLVGPDEWRFYSVQATVSN